MVIKHVDHAQFSNVFLPRNFWRQADISGTVQIFQTNTHGFISLLKLLSFLPAASFPLLLMTISLSTIVCVTQGFPNFLLAD